jgi:hypothetical protein
MMTKRPAIFKTVVKLELQINERHHKRAERKLILLLNRCKAKEEWEGMLITRIDINPF